MPHMDVGGRKHDLGKLANGQSAWNIPILRSPQRPGQGRNVASGGERKGRAQIVDECGDRIVIPPAGKHSGAYRAVARSCAASTAAAVLPTSCLLE